MQIRRSTDEWTKKSDTPTLRGNAINTQPSSDPVVEPIGDALWLIGLLAGGYMLVKKTRRAE